MSVNKVIIIGRLGKDPELKMTKDQTEICNFSVATSEKFKDTEKTEWHNIICFGKTAENCAKYLQKGREVFIEGKIQTRKWQDKEGKDRYTTEIICHTIKFIGKQEQSERPNVDHLPGAEDYGSGAVPFDDDDIPF